MSNDYVVRLQNHFSQLLPPVHPGPRGGRVVIEQRLDGSLAIRLRDKYLTYREGGKASDGRSDNVPTADISNVA